MQVLVLEDAPHIRTLLTKGLESKGHDVIAAENKAAAEALLQSKQVDLVIVDRILPDGDGLDLVREMRQAGRETPAICLTVRDRVEDRVEGLRAGVDDYLLKPFSFEELLARIDAVTRRSGVKERFNIGPLSLDAAAHNVTIDGQPVDLSAREFALLLALARNTGQVMTRRQILEEVWGIRQEEKRTNVVDVYIRYLRSKLGTDLIRTVRGVGYMLSADGNHGSH